MRLFKFLLLIVFIFSLFISLILTNVQIISFNSYFYKIEFLKYNVPNTTKISLENLENISLEVRKYFKDERNNLDVKSNIDGKTRNVFNEQELYHMKDVKKLFKKGFLIRSIFVILLMLSLTGIVLLKQYKPMYKSIKWLALMSVILISIFILLLITDFNKYFTYFHEIFFNENCWLFDPSKSLLVNIFPEGLFNDAAIYILLMYFAELFFIMLISRKLIK